jgi:tRNA(adenine34) deaminase
MLEALIEAEKAYKLGEVPIGAVLAEGDKIIARAHNLIETLKDATVHAEMLVIREASQELKNWRLNSFTLYVTLEPCVMCMGAIQNSRIGKVVFGAWDKVAGACGSVHDLSYDNRMKRKIEINGGIEETKCLALLKKFFKQIRSPDGNTNS